VSVVLSTTMTTHTLTLWLAYQCIYRTVQVALEDARQSILSCPTFMVLSAAMTNCISTRKVVASGMACVSLAMIVSVS
jgi:hypothetical protein